MARVDVTVLGAGIFGLCCAWSVLGRGARVRVIDPGGIGAGASGGIVGALAPHVPEQWNPKKQFQFESLLVARKLWPQIEAVSGMASGYVRAGRVQPLADDAAIVLARARAAGARKLWQGEAQWAVENADDWCPSPTGFVVRDTLSAHIHPRQAVAALAEACRKRGAEIVGEGPVEGVVIHTTGAAGLAELSRGARRAVGQGIKGQAALLSADHSGSAQVFADGLHVIPHLEGTVAIGSTTERDVDDLRCDAQVDDLVARARLAVPLLAGSEVVERWAGWRPRARSRAPVLGRFPGRSGHFVANGGFKIGFGMAPKVGEVMADLVIDGRVSYPPEFELEAVMGG